MRRLRPAMGCFVRIEARGLTAAALATAVDAAYARIEAVEQALSFHRIDSELHALHRHALHQPRQVGDDLWAVLTAAYGFWKQSDGNFDPGIAAALVRDGLLPRPQNLPEPDACARFGAVELLADRQVRLSQPLWLDFGGVAKGYAVDRALDVLRSAGASSACVNAGGDLAGFGDEWPVALRDPQAPGEIAGVIRIRDAACASTGSYFQPGALREADGHRAKRTAGSVSIVAADCMTADALTKIVWLAPQNAEALLARHGASRVTLPSIRDVAMESALDHAL